MARAETAYLEYPEDFLTLSTQEDNTISWLETLVEYIALDFNR